MFQEVYRSECKWSSPLTPPLPFSLRSDSGMLSLPQHHPLLGLDLERRSGRKAGVTGCLPVVGGLFGLTLSWPGSVCHWWSVHVNILHMGLEGNVRLHSTSPLLKDSCVCLCRHSSTFPTPSPDGVIFT